MSSITDLIRALAAAGAPPEAIAIAVEAVERLNNDDQSKLDARRKADRERKARQRLRATCPCAKRR